MYVAREVAEDSPRRSSPARRKLRVGDPMDWDTEIGPMVSREQFELVRELVDDAVASGAELRCGGPDRRREAHFAPAVLTGVTHDMPYRRRVDWQEYEREGVEALRGAADRDALEGARVRFLGLKSPLKLALRGVRDRESGTALNGARVALETAADEREQELAAAAPAALVYDVTEPAALSGWVQRRGHLHPITQIRREVEDVFLGLGYEVIDGREVENVHYNFEGLNFPPISIQPEYLQTRQPSPSQMKQETSGSIDGSVNGEVVRAEADVALGPEERAHQRPAACPSGRRASARGRWRGPRGGRRSG